MGDGWDWETFWSHHMFLLKRKHKRTRCEADREALTLAFLHLTHVTCYGKPHRSSLVWRECLSEAASDNLLFLVCIHPCMSFVAHREIITAMNVNGRLRQGLGTLLHGVRSLRGRAREKHRGETWFCLPFTEKTPSLPHGMKEYVL